MVKRLQITPEKQEYRDNLAWDLKRLRSYGDTWKKLADVLLKKEKESSEYMESKKYTKEAADQLINEWNSDFVCYNLDKFEWLDKEIAEKLIKCWGSSFVTDNFEKFEWLDKERAENLLDEWYYSFVLSNLNKFEWLDYEKVADKLIEVWECWYLVHNIEKFEWLDYKNVADKLIKSERADNILFLINNIDEFKWLNHKEVVENLINNTNFNVMYHMNKFIELNHNDRMEIIDKWLDKKQGWFSVLDSIGQFEEWEQEDILVKLFERGYFYEIKSRNFHNLLYWCKFNRKTLAMKYIEKWGWHTVACNPERFWLKKEDN